MNIKPKVSIKDVARKAGVSTATVSHVINNSRGTRESTRVRVWKAVESLGYAQNLAARSLAVGKIGILGFIISDVRNPFFPDIIASFQDRALEHRLETIILNTNYDPHRTIECVRRLVGLKVSGIAVMTSEFDKSLVSMLIENEIPSVYLDTGEPGRHIGNISIDYEKGIDEALVHLSENGHKRIAYIGGPVNLLSAIRRKKAFLNACERLRLSPVATTDADFTIKGGYRSSAKLFGRQNPTAIVCGNDLTAIGALHCAYDRGMRVPEEISVIGFDDILFAEYTQPALTTVAMSRREIGSLAFRAISELTDAAHRDGVEYEVETYLVRRQSTGRASE